MNKKVPAKLQLENLKKISTLLPDNFEYFIFYGTLLGFVRDGNIIPHDDDIDIFIYKKHRKDIFSILKKSNFNISLNRTDIVQVQQKYKGIKTFVDFYFYTKYENKNYIYEPWTSKLPRIRKAGFKVHIPNNMIFPLQQVKLQGIDIKVPHAPKECVKFIYGDTYMTPLKKGYGKYELYPSLRM